MTLWIPAECYLFIPPGPAPLKPAQHLPLPYLPSPTQVRKRAQSGLVEMLAALQNTPALGPASEAVARAAAELLPVPEVSKGGGLGRGRGIAYRTGVVREHQAQ
jgi:hypothetical protein